MIEALISITLVVVVVMSIYSVLAGVVKNIGDSKQRIGALALGNEKMEIFRNLDYNDIGTINGIVSGPVPAEEIIVRNGFNYKVFCEVRYVDDVLDGFFPEDVVDTDYKRVRVRIQWSNGGNNKEINFYDNFVPDGLETNVGGGTLMINTIDYSGNPVSDVNIIVDSVNDEPNVFFSSTTDVEGHLLLQGVASQNYRISLSKENYETVSTYPNPPESIFTPVDPDIFVEEGVLNTKTFYISPSGTLNFKTVKAEDGKIIPNFNLAISGGRIIGTEPETFSLNENVSLGGDGFVEILNASPGSYYVNNTNELETEDYLYIGSSQNYPIVLAGGQIQDIYLVFANKNITSLAIFLSDALLGNRIEGATVRLVGENFDQEILTTKEGIAYFPLATDPITVMSPGSYQLEIIKEGYLNYSATIDIDKLRVENISLTAN